MAIIKAWTEDDYNKAVQARQSESDKINNSLKQVLETLMGKANAVDGDTITLTKEELAEQIKQAIADASTESVTAALANDVKEPVEPVEPEPAPKAAAKTTTKK